VLFIVRLKMVRKFYTASSLALLVMMLMTSWLDIDAQDPAKDGEGEVEGEGEGEEFVTIAPVPVTERPKPDYDQMWSDFKRNYNKTYEDSSVEAYR